MLSKQLWIRGEGKSGIHLTEVSVFARMAGKNKHFRDLSQQVLSGVVAKNTDDKNRKNRKNNKYHKIQNLERQRSQERPRNLRKCRKNRKSNKDFCC